MPPYATHMCESSLGTDPLSHAPYSNKTSRRKRPQVLVMSYGAQFTVPVGQRLSQSSYTWLCDLLTGVNDEQEILHVFKCLGIIQDLYEQTKLGETMTMFKSCSRSQVVLKCFILRKMCFQNSVFLFCSSFFITKKTQHSKKKCFESVLGWFLSFSLCFC